MTRHSDAFVRAGVIGHPVAQSLSPRLHQYWMERYGLDGAYEAIDVAPGDLLEKLTELAAAGYRGVNITIPHKQAVIPLLGQLDAIAAKIGAVNTVIFTEKEGWQGRNTDAAGFLKNLQYQQPHWSAKERRILVLGAGGAARAVLYALQEAGCGEIFLANRTREKADRLSELFPVATPIPWQERRAVLETVSLLVNTTSLGMIGSAALDMDLSALAGDAIIYDLVYNPLMTPLLSSARNRGNPIVTGLGMLAFQGAAAFESWFGIPPEVDRALMDYLHPGPGG